MSLINLIVVFVFVGVLLYLINTYIPMAAPIKKLMNIAVVIVLVLFLLRVLGLSDALNMRI